MEDPSDISPEAMERMIADLPAWRDKLTALGFEATKNDHYEYFRDGFIKFNDHCPRSTWDKIEVWRDNRYPAALVIVHVDLAQLLHYGYHVSLNVVLPLVEQIIAIVQGASDKHDALLKLGQLKVATPDYVPPVKEAEEVPKRRFSRNPSVPDEPTYASVDRLISKSLRPQCLPKGARVRINYDRSRYHGMLGTVLSASWDSVWVRIDNPEAQRPADFEEIQFSVTELEWLRESLKESDLDPEKFFQNTFDMIATLERLGYKKMGDFHCWIKSLQLGKRPLGIFAWPDWPDRSHFSLAVNLKSRKQNWETLHQIVVPVIEGLEALRAVEALIAKSEGNWITLVHDLASLRGYTCTDHITWQKANTDFSESLEAEDPDPDDSINPEVYLRHLTAWQDVFFERGCQTDDRSLIWKKYDFPAWEYRVYISTRHHYIDVERTDKMYGTNEFRRVFDEIWNDKVQVKLFTQFDDILERSRNTVRYHRIEEVDKEIGAIYIKFTMQKQLRQLGNPIDEADSDIGDPEGYMKSTFEPYERILKPLGYVLSDKKRVSWHKAIFRPPLPEALIYVMLRELPERRATPLFDIEVNRAGIGTRDHEWIHISTSYGVTLTSLEFRLKDTERLVKAGKWSTLDASAPVSEAVDPSDEAGLLNYATTAANNQTWDILRENGYAWGPFQGQHQHYKLVLLPAPVKDNINTWTHVYIAPNAASQVFYGFASEDNSCGIGSIHPFPAKLRPGQHFDSSKVSFPLTLKRMLRRIEMLLHKLPTPEELAHIGSSKNVFAMWFDTRMHRICDEVDTLSNTPLTESKAAPWVEAMLGGGVDDADSFLAKFQPMAYTLYAAYNDYGAQRSIGVYDTLSEAINVARKYGLVNDESHAWIEEFTRPSIRSLLADRTGRIFDLDENYNAIERKVQEAADPDEVNPEHYIGKLIRPFDAAVIDGQWKLTYQGKAVDWYPDEKNATFMANACNDLHQEKLYVHDPWETPSNWYWRVKWGKVSKPWSPHYQPPKRRRRVREAADPDAFDYDKYAQTYGVQFKIERGDHDDYNVYTGSLRFLGSFRWVGSNSKFPYKLERTHTEMPVRSLPRYFSTPEQVGLFLALIHAKGEDEGEKEFYNAERRAPRWQNETTDPDEVNPESYVDTTFDLPTFLDRAGFIKLPDTGAWEKFAKDYPLPQPYVLGGMHFVKMRIRIDYESSSRYGGGSYVSAWMMDGQDRGLAVQQWRLTPQQVHAPNEDEGFLGSTDLELAIRRFVHGLDGIVTSIPWPKNKAALPASTVTKSAFDSYTNELNALSQQPTRTSPTHETQLV